MRVRESPNTPFTIIYERFKEGISIIMRIESG